MVSPELTVALTLAVSVTLVAVKSDTVWPPVMAPRSREKSETVVSFAIQSGTLLNVKIALDVAVADVVTMLPPLPVDLVNLPKCIEVT